MPAILAAVLAALGLLLRLVDGTTLHDPWVWALAALLLLSLHLAGVGSGFSWRGRSRT